MPKTFYLRCRHCGNCGEAETEGEAPTPVPCGECGSEDIEVSEKPFE